VKKIPSIFERDWDGDRSLVTDKPTEAHTMLDGATATRKWDGTAAMVRDGRVYKRYDCKPGKTAPDGFEPAQDKDEKTGHWPGWIPVDRGKPEDKWFCDADLPENDGTYELCGPKIGGNPEGFDHHLFLEHGNLPLYHIPTDYDGLLDFFTQFRLEGIVWWKDGEPVGKIKRRDFGLPWPVTEEG